MADPAKLRHAHEQLQGAFEHARRSCDYAYAGALMIGLLALDDAIVALTPKEEKTNEAPVTPEAP